MIVFGRAFSLLRTYWCPWLAINLLYFGLVGAGMAYGTWDPDTHDALTGDLKQDAQRVLPAVFRAYKDGHVATAIAVTFLINLLAGSLLFITLPSLVVPYSGLVLGSVRAVMWGLIFTPHFFTFSSAGILSDLLIGVLILMEGEAYVLAMLAAYVQGNAFLFPAAAGAATRWQGYQIGAVRSLHFYVLIALTLAVAAVYEAVIAILILPLLK